MIARMVAYFRARRGGAHAHGLVHDPLTAASEQRWERQQRLAAVDAQIIDAATAFRSTSGEETTAPRAVVDLPHPPCGPSPAEGSPDVVIDLTAPRRARRNLWAADHRPDRIDAAVIAFDRLHRPHQGDTPA